MGFLGNVFGAAFDTIKQEGPQLVKQAVMTRLREQVRGRAPRPKGSPWATVRLTEKKEKKPRIRSVSEKVSNMPPEWRGWAKTKRVIVYHHSSFPHVEAYIEWEGQAYNIWVKRLPQAEVSKLKYNNKGELTQNSRDGLMKFIQKEYEGRSGIGSFLGQSTDHEPDEARESWSLNDPRYKTGYGGGPYRTVLSDDDIVVWKMGEVIEGRDHVIDPDRDFYVFRPFESTMKIGLKHNKPPALEDRLHLKPFIGKETWDKFRDRVGPNGTMTIKHDGASAYFEVTEEGTRFWSPRKSKATGKQIEYTHKLRGLRHVTSKQRTVGMGELMFTRNGKYLKAHEVGGILNSHSPIPDDVEPEFVMYRIDRVGRKSFHTEDYKHQLKIASTISKSASRKGIDNIKTPTVVPHDQALEHAADHEGLVGIPEGKSLLDGMKFKPRGDEYDWTVEEVAIKHGGKGGMAGVVWFRNESGERFKMGAGALGDHANAREMMKNPHKFEGRVAKVACYQGHEGRAARFVAWHDGKGVA